MTDYIGYSTAVSGRWFHRLVDHPGGGHDKACTGERFFPLARNRIQRKDAGLSVYREPCPKCYPEGLK